jgi:hypothetical protein
LAALDPATRDAFCSDYCAAQDAVQAGVVSSRSAASDSHWAIWSSFCISLALDPLMADVEEPVAILQVFAH